MNQKITIALLLVTIAIAGGCDRQTPEDLAEVAYKELRQALQETDDPREKAELAENYLAQFPATDHSGRIAATIAHYRGEQLQEPRQVFDSLQPALEHIEDPEARFEVSMALFPSSHEVNQPLDLAGIADDLAAHRSLGYDDHQMIAEAAEKQGLWSLTERHADAALAFATEDVFRADYEGRDFTDEQVTKYARQRRVTSLAYQGWALCNLGRDEEGFSRFEEAAPFNEDSYVGAPATPLNVFWGKALAQRGEYAQAAEFLLPDAVFGDAKNALPAIREVHAALNGDDGNFDDYLWSARQDMARDVDDFTLPDYGGTPHALSGFDGEVVLLAFWFPT
jgi:hypothetical protein